MGFLIGLFTLAMVLDCAVLILLVLIQLPKKEAGAGLAFGGGATDALFGSGSGNVLTKITKYAAGIFFVLAIFLALLQKSYHSRGVNTYQEKLAQPAPAAPAARMPAIPPAAPATAPETAPLVVIPTNLATTPQVEQPAPSPAATNAAPVPAAPAPK
jgi:preprotein translocase subunit SecG